MEYEDSEKNLNMQRLKIQSTYTLLPYGINAFKQDDKEDIKPPYTMTIGF